MPQTDAAAGLIWSVREQQTWMARSDWRGRQPDWIFILTRAHLMNNWEAVDRQHCCCCCCCCCLFFFCSFPLFLPSPAGPVAWLLGFEVNGQKVLKGVAQTAALGPRRSHRGIALDYFVSFCSVQPLYKFTRGLKFTWFDVPSYADLKSCAHATSAISAASHCQPLCIYCARRSSLWCHPGHYLWQCLVGLPLP